MTIAFVVNLRRKSDGCHLICIARQLDPLKAHKALDAAIDENLNFTSILEKREQSFVAELQNCEVRWVCAVDVLIYRAIEDIVVDLKFKIFP